MSETDPRPSAEINRELWARGGPLRVAIQNVFTDPSYEIADSIDRFVDEYPGRVLEFAHARPVDEIPYSVYDLPPNLFDHVPGKQPFIPESDEAIEAYVDDFWPRHLQLHSSVPGFHAHATMPDFRVGLIENLKKSLAAGRVIDPQDWAMYQVAYQNQMERKFYTLGHNASVMNLPDLLPFANMYGILDAAKGHHSTYLLASLNSPHRIGIYLRVPIGPYGRGFAERLIRTGSFMSDFIDQSEDARTRLWDAARQNPAIIENHTTRGKSNRRLSNGIIYGNEDSTIVAEQSGIDSMIAVINLLGSEVTLDNADDLMATIEANDLINRLTLLLSLGTAGSAASGGIFLEHLMRNPTEFSEDAVKVLRGLRNGLSARAIAKWHHHDVIAAAEGEAAADAQEPIVFLNLPCPVAGAHETAEGTKIPGAISRYTSTFHKAFRIITPAPADHRFASTPWNVPRLFPANGM